METRRRDALKFMENFDPEKSKREKRKLNRKLYVIGKKPLTHYDSRGLLAGADLCDCLTQYCPGCHFPCPKCGSAKCGPECRVNRKWAYDKIEIEGTAP